MILKHAFMRKSQFRYFSVIYSNELTNDQKGKKVKKEEDFMKKIVLGLAFLIVGSIVLPSTTSVYAASSDASNQEVILPENVVIENTENGDMVTKYEDGYSAEDFAGDSTEVVEGIVAYAAVSRWGKLEYTNIAVTTGVAANAINAAYWAHVYVRDSWLGNWWSPRSCKLDTKRRISWSRCR
jgi:hypothetical protein